MNKAHIKEFVSRYRVYSNSQRYLDRREKIKLNFIFNEIMYASLQAQSLSKEKLTGFIHMFKHDVSSENFEKYLDICIGDEATKESILKSWYQSEEKGIPGAGKRAINNIDKHQLEQVHKFLADAFEISNVKDAVALCEHFDSLNIPEVKSGVYSPWLYYIKPTIFPILNKSHNNFRNWLEIPADYPSNILAFNELKKFVGETDLGIIDGFAHDFNLNDPVSNDHIINLSDKRLFKVSHGMFVKHADYRDSGISSVLEERNLIVIGIYNKQKAQLNNFKTQAQVGDYVYVCHGGNGLICIAQITSDVFPVGEGLLPVSSDDQAEFFAREIKPLFRPIVKETYDLKELSKNYYPSGNSTFFQVPKDVLNEVNTNLFQPKFGVTFIDSETSNSRYMTNPVEPVSSLLKAPMNQILYGPPGTGKTFHSVSHSVAIVENKSIESILEEERELVKNRFDQYVKDGQIVFCTFHQSLSYEDFIEGIKPIEPSAEDEELTYAVEDGIFKRLCTEAAFSFIQNNTTTEIENVLDFSTEYDRFVDMVNESFSKGQKVELQTRSGGNVYIESISQNNNIWVRHLEGNRNYTVSKKRLSKISLAFPELSEVTNINDQFKAEIGGSNSSAYWAVLNAIRSQPASDSPKIAKIISEKEYSYDDKKEIIESLKNVDFKIENPKKFVLIIDEINRGNVSQIFGELITLIEDDKRLGEKEALRASLPYSKESFGVPNNIYIIGTMNTADRSVEALDTALRRRFSFVPKAPKPDELKITTDGINLPKILSVLNNRLSVLKDNDHTIGHAWLWNVSDLGGLKIVFRDKILPLLQEYFYNDYEKLGLVLGDAFFEPHVQINSDIFASFTGGNGLAGQYDQTWQYQLKSADELTIEDFKTLERSINQPAQDEE
jgi:5-methylcytosine-specific restriction endonuclease McrBC GTP-binding regulatory subunit McrB